VLVYPDSSKGIPIVGDWDNDGDATDEEKTAMSELGEAVTRVLSTGCSGNGFFDQASWCFDGLHEPPLSVV